MTGLRADVPVVIVGGGPVGLVAGLALARRGVESVVLEAGNDEVRAEWRGSTLHPPTLEILEELGLVEPVRAGSVRVDRLDYRDLELTETAVLSYSALEGLTRYPFRTQFEQYKLLRLLRTAVDDTPLCSIEYGARVVALRQSADGVVLRVDTANGTREITCAWAVGADGARSTTRGLTGIEFPGTTYPFQSLIVATPFPFEEHVPDLGPVGYWTGPNGRFSLIRTPDVWRTALSTTTPADASAGAGSDLHPAFPAATRLLLGDTVAMPVQQHQLYRSHQRVATTFRADRVLLAGDAAHVSSTTGGMGLNSGVHDAWELAAALAAALRTGDPSRVDGYALNRRRVAVDVVQPSTTTARSGADIGDRESRRARLVGLRRIAADVDTTREHLAAASMLGTVRIPVDA